METTTPAKKTRARKTVPPSATMFTDWHIEGEREMFNFWNLQLDVTAAKEILKKDPRESVSLNVDAWKETVSWEKDTMDALRILIDHKKVETMTEDSLNVPLIIALLKGYSGQVSPVLIDGNHRLALAAKLGKKELRAVVLTEKETKKVLRG